MAVVRRVGRRVAAHGVLLECSMMAHVLRILAKLASSNFRKFGQTVAYSQNFRTRERSDVHGKLWRSPSEAVTLQNLPFRRESTKSPDSSRKGLHMLVLEELVVQEVEQAPKE